MLAEMALSEGAEESRLPPPSPSLCSLLSPQQAMQGDPPEQAPLDLFTLFNGRQPAAAAVVTAMASNSPGACRAKLN